MATGTDITAQRAREFGIKGQQKGESDNAFRNRVSGALRAQGHIIEAHEAFNNALYDDPNNDNPMTGILGAAAQALQGRNYRAKTGQQQVGDDIASGLVVKSPKDDGAGLLGLMAIMLGMDK